MNKGEKTAAVDRRATLVSVAGLSKKFVRRAGFIDALRRAARPLRTGGTDSSSEDGFWALKDLSFSLERGDLLGVIGENGAGKSTLLQILAGISAPTGGKVEVNGTTGALLELGSGFHGEFTGRRNIFLAGAILGFSRKRILRQLDEIIDFAGLGEFIHQPVRTYSSGMFLRLAFAVNACLEPDLLLVDEILSVGDFFFQQKCHKKMEDLLGAGMGMVLVSHDMGAIQKYCRRALLLHKGSPVFLGDTSTAVGLYHRLHGGGETAGGETAGPAAGAPGFSIVAGEKRVRLVEVRVAGENGLAIPLGLETGETAVFEYAFEVLEDILTPVASLQIADRMNLNVHGKSSLHLETKTPSRVKAGSLIRVRQSVAMNLNPGEYSIGIGLGEIPEEIAGNAAELDTGLLESRVRYLLMARIDAPVLVRPRTSGPKKPFFGLADLPGTMSVHITGP